MKKVWSLLLCLSLALTLSSQEQFIEIRHNAILGSFSFIDTASGAPGSAPSYQGYINAQLEKDEQFDTLVAQYKKLDLQANIKREGYPEKRHSYISVKDLLWIHSANASSIEDFSSRTLGLLSPHDHATLIAIIKKTAPYYKRLVWDTTSASRTAIEQQMQPYKSQIANLFAKVDHFIGSQWPKSTPFNIILYPIPLDRGGTTAIPKGNNLICSYLAGRNDEAKDLVGIAVHEMNHILYDAQPLALQQQIDNWFTASTHPHAHLAYDFFDEGLATAVGNGWAYEQINGVLDQGEWYNFKYINGYGKGLYPLVKSYIEANKVIDQQFIEEAISIFATQFPDALTDLELLMNNVNIFSQTEEMEDINRYFEGIQQRFTMRSAYFSSPLEDEKAQLRFRESNRTKFIVLNKEDVIYLDYLASLFTDFPQRLNLKQSFLSSFYDQTTQSDVILVYLDHPNDYSALLDKLKKAATLKHGKMLTLD